MAQKYIMTSAGSVDHGPTSTVSGGAFTITSTASPNVAISGNGVHVSPLKFTFTGGDAAGFVNGSVYSVAPQSITSAAKNVNVDGANTMNEDDTGAIELWGTPTGAGPPPDTVVPGATAIVDDAGQDKATGD
jgi:hypothetical protein